MVSNGAFAKGPPLNINMQGLRPLCRSCQVVPAEVNYVKNGAIHYRSRCHQCARLNRPHKKQKPRWASAGYVKKTVCDRCGFRAKHPAQLSVFHIDGNLNNTSSFNLKTVCANCFADPKFKSLGWSQGDLTPDYV
jgi:protein-arginine kinase activator protein McsA